VREITREDLKTIPDIKQGLKGQLGRLIDGVFPEKLDRRSFRALLVQLYQQRGDGLPVSRWVPASELAAKWRSLTPFEEVLALASGPDVGLLRVSDETSAAGETTQVSLGHPALAAAVAGLEEEALRRQERRKAIVDTLWIMIPIVIVLGFFAFMRMLAATQNKEVAEQRLLEGRQWFQQAKKIEKLHQQLMAV